MKILFICGGNVARSQMAEAFFNSAANGKHTASSCGTKVTVREGQKLKDKDMNIVTAMQEIGIDVSNYERKRFTPEAFETADKVIVMVPSENIPDYFNKNTKVIFWEVPDPFQQSLEFARNVRDRIAGLVNDFTTQLP